MASLDNVIEITQLLKQDQIDFFLLTVENFGGKPKFFVEYEFKDKKVSLEALRHIHIELDKIIKSEDDKTKQGISQTLKQDSKQGALKPKRSRKNPNQDDK